MSEVKLHIDDHYLQAFLDFLRTIDYVRVEKVTDSANEDYPANATESFLAGLAEDNPLRQVIKPIRKGKVTAEDLIRESGYLKTDWNKVKEIGEAMDIPQSLEELLAQLTP